MRAKTISNYAENFAKDIKYINGITSFKTLFKLQLLKLLEQQIKFISFEEDSVFNRNFVMHGRFNPKYYTEEMFFKLVLLCSTTASFVEDDMLLLELRNWL